MSGNRKGSRRYKEEGLFLGEYEQIGFDSTEEIMNTDTNEFKSEKVPLIAGDNGIKEDDYPYSPSQRRILAVQQGIYGLYKKHSSVIWNIIGCCLLVAYIVYLGFAIHHSFGDEASWRLLGFSIFGIVLLLMTQFYKFRKNDIDLWWINTIHFRMSKPMQIFKLFMKWFLRIGVFAAIIVYILIDVVIDHPQNLVAVAGLFLCLLLLYITSINPARVNWHTVFCGIAMQYVFAIVILRTQWGYDIFQWLGDRVTEFLEYVVAGIVFVYGEDYVRHFFAMKVMSIIVFFYTFINILYYLGVMQAIIKVLGRFLAFCMETTPAESINAAANIFVSMTESPLMIRPFLRDMTRSELHAVMTSGFATIAGSVLGAYISFGVPANHLISACVMSAPAALAISKLSYPETQRTKASREDFSKLNSKSTKDRNLIEAASNGAVSSMKIVGSVIVHVLAFISLLAFVNATLTWFGDRVGFDNLTFEYICSYVLYPVAYFMGVETEDCRKVAELVGVKTFTNEFIAYGDLQVLIQNRNTFTNYTEEYNNTGWYWEDGNIVLNKTGETLEGGVISEKSEIIATYALCGFANIGSIGITLGALSTLAPTRKLEISQMVLRAMICGNIACFLTACIAGLFYEPL